MKPVGVSNSRHDWWQANSSDSDDKPVSPSAGVKCFLQENSIEDDLSRDEKMALSGYLKEIENSPDSPTYQVKGNRIERSMTAFASAMSPHHPPGTSQFHHDAYPKMVGSSWANRALLRLSAIPCRYPTELGKLITRSVVPIINLPHIVTGDSHSNTTKGVHFCPAGSPLKSTLTGIFLNPDNGVFCAKLPDGKFSTFFPESLSTEEDLIQLIKTSESLSLQSENRTLKRAKLGNGKTIYIETLNRGNLFTHSAYPIFFYGLLDETVDFLFQRFGIQGENIKKILNSEKLEELVIYEDNERFVIDVAPFFDELKEILPKGIYMEIRREQSH